MRSRKKKHPETQIGVGSGGNQQGDKNPYWKGGNSIYRKTYLSLSQGKECCTCGGTKHLVVHHKDGDRSNNNIENLMLVCRSCHSVIHDLHKNLKNAEIKPTQNGELGEKIPCSQ